MNVTFCQMNPTVGDFEANALKIEKAYDSIDPNDTDLVMFPELAICGYPPRDLLLRNSFIERNLEILGQLAKRIKGPPALVGYVDRNTTTGGRPLRNAAAWIQNGKVQHCIHKILLPTYDVFDEDRYFEPGEKVTLVEHMGKKWGVTICEDIWNDAHFWPERRYARDPVTELMNRGMEGLLNLSASPWHLGKDLTRFRMLQALAERHRIPIAYCNMVGGNDELIFDGASMAIGSEGRLIQACKIFREDQITVNLFHTGTGSWPSKEVGEDLFNALTLGLRDYLSKCGFRSVVLGLSGGIDSAVTAAIAVAAVGREHVLGVAMPSAISSEGSVVDARILAKNLGIRFETIAIQPLMDVFQKSLAPLFAGKSEDVTEENLQSRIRGVLLMALSNKYGSLLLTTGNKSEMATGYCTLYGDMNGGLAVLSDLSKNQVYQLAHWINQHSEKTDLSGGVIPEDTLNKPPSAELRPGQLDQDSLPPYDVLDQILAGFVERQQSVSEIVKNGVEERLVLDIIRKIDVNEYKRRQAPPGLKVSSKAFGMGRRIPIAQRFREPVISK